MITRRSFIGAAAAIGATGWLPALPAAAAPRRQLVAGKRTIEVAGRAADVFGLTDESGAGASGLVLGPGERFSVDLVNRLDQETIVHWHGQTPAPELDGVASTGYVAPLEAGEARGFDFNARPGTHWMHAHHMFQEQLLLTAPLIVHRDTDTGLDLHEVTLLLNDFSFRHPLEIFEGLTSGSGMHHGDGHGGHSMHQMDLNDVEYDAYLANDRTLDDPQVVRTEGNGRVRLRIINAAASTAFWIDLEGHEATVLAVDGNDVRPVTGTIFPLAQAQRLDLLVEVTAGAVVPVFARREGDVARTGLVLAAPGASIRRLASAGDAAAPPVDLSLEELLEATQPLPQKATSLRHWVMLTGGMSPYEWSLNDRPWSGRHRLRVRHGQRVEIGFRNTSSMAHPMHLHGHHFQVINVNGRRIAGAMRDTVLVPPNSTVVVAFGADNPGRWLYHCHNLYHMMAGMMSEVVYEN